MGCAAWTHRRLLKMASAPSDIPEDVIHTIERFVILLYDRTSTSSNIDKTRKKLFAKKTNVQLIPPTKAALDEHVKRASYQGGHVWGQTLLPTPELPPPTNWGWIKNVEGFYEPLWTRLPEAAETCYELVSCKCKKGCVKRCKCKKAVLECTALCACEGECSQNWITEHYSWDKCCCVNNMNSAWSCGNHRNFPIRWRTEERHLYLLYNIDLLWNGHH